MATATFVGRALAMSNKPELTATNVRRAIQRGETLVSLLRTSSQPIVEMPSRESMSEVLDILTRFSRLYLRELRG